MPRINCWDVKKCERTPGGNKAAEFGVCFAATDLSANGLNGGKNGGRICWAITGTLCGGEVQGTEAQKRLSCMGCEFYKQVKEEEGLGSFKMMKEGQVYKPHAQKVQLHVMMTPVF